MKRSWIIAMVIVGACVSTSCAQSVPADPPSSSPLGTGAIPLYGSANPGRIGDEMSTGSDGGVRNVTYPTLTPVLPRPETANGAAVIVAPGGAFMSLSIESEGLQVARKLADQGITAFVLKYRLNPTPRSKLAYTASVLMALTGTGGNSSRSSLDPSNAIKDGVAALKLVRSRSIEWKIDPERVGIIGFSAGAITAISPILDAGKRDSSATTPPAFIGYIYGPMDAAKVPPNAPPLFAALAMDDFLFGKKNFDIVQSWRNAKRPVELHVYQGGGHGFGIGKPGTTNAMIMPEFIAWLKMQGFLSPDK